MLRMKQFIPIHPPMPAKAVRQIKLLLKIRARSAAIPRRPAWCIMQADAPQAYDSDWPDRVFAAHGTAYTSIADLAYADFSFKYRNNQQETGA